MHASSLTFLARIRVCVVAPDLVDSMEDVPMNKFVTGGSMGGSAGDPRGIQSKFRGSCHFDPCKKLGDPVRPLPPPI